LNSSPASCKTKNI